MAERRKYKQPQLPFQIQTGLPVQIEVPAGASITISPPGEPTKPTVIPRTAPIDVQKYYPKEPSVGPDVVSDYVQQRIKFGEDHMETHRAEGKLTKSMEDAQLRGFPLGRVLDDVEDTLFEARRQLEGRKLGSESMRLKPVRDEIVEDALEEYLDGPGHEDPA